MIQSITFTPDSDPWSDWKNTWDDWKIVAVERPVFAPPKPKTTYVDIPGGNGSLDLSESLTGYPVYENRSGSFTFKVLNDYKEWQERYTEIMEYLHGRRMRAILIDDGAYFYRGRFAVDSWESGDTWSEITISYEAEPFKWQLLSSAELWKWDPFNFDTGVTNDTLYTLYANKEIGTCTSGSTTTEMTFSNVEVGVAPINPEFIVTGLPEGAALTMTYSNAALDISGEETLTNGSNFVYDCIFYGQTEYTLTFKYAAPSDTSATTDGVYVSIDFRVGRL